MQGMESYTRAAMERAMKIQEVILRAAAKEITWWQAGQRPPFAPGDAPHTCLHALSGPRLARFP